MIWLSLLRIKLGLRHLSWLQDRCDRAMDEKRFDDAAVEFARVKIVQAKVERLFRRVEPEGRPA